MDSLNEAIKNSAEGKAIGLGEKPLPASVDQEPNPTITPVSKKYKIIYADPPWSYNRNTGNGAANNHYPTMSLDDIKAIGTDVKAVSDDDTILALWATWPLLPEAMEVIKEWGFTYKTCFHNWVKYNSITKKYGFGGGSYTRAGSEICLLGVKKKIPKRYSKSVRQVLLEPNRQHSRKPAVVRDHLVDVFGDVPRIELFARELVSGWTVYGNETNKFNSEQS